MSFRADLYRALLQEARVFLGEGSRRTMAASGWGESERYQGPRSGREVASVASPVVDGNGESPGSRTNLQRISVVIPTLNEEAHIDTTLAAALEATDVEVLVVDAQSTDATRSCVQRHQCRLIAGQRGRARQMNAGAAKATGELLLFLHADTQLPAGYDMCVRKTLQQENVVAGAFRLRVAAPGFTMRCIEWGVNVRSRSFGVPYGDQAIFMRATDFEAAGGFPDLPIMEDYALMHAMRRRGRIRVADANVITSARRWRTLGAVRTTWVNQLVILGYHLGISPQRLASWYARR